MSILFNGAGRTTNIESTVSLQPNGVTVIKRTLNEPSVVYLYLVIYGKAVSLAPLPNSQIEEPTPSLL